MSDKFLRHANAVILHRKLVCCVVFQMARLFAQPNHDISAGLCKLDGIAYNIQQHLIQSELVREHILMHHILCIDKKILILCLDKALDHRTKIVQQIRDMHFRLL